eukprot:SAG11_NODE_149_length_14661_cov_10.031658_13_plen_67_part_00
MTTSSTKFSQYHRNLETNRCRRILCDASVGIFHRKMDIAPDVGGTAVPATMAGEMRDLEPIIPDFV